MRGWSDVFKEIILQAQNDAVCVHGRSHPRQPLRPETYLEMYEMWEGELPLMGLGLFYNDKVTLFNYFCDPDTEEEKCYLTLLENVNLVETKGANVTKSGMDSADAAKLFVDLGKIPKPYMEPKAWDALPDDEKPNYITFHPTDDFFIKGDHTDLELPESEAYGWAHDNLDSVYKVTTVDRYEDIMPHFEVGGV